MTEADIAALAIRIADTSFALHWYQYLLIIACTFVGAAAGAYSSAYFRKRGETFATKADFETLLSQLRATTDMTEDIRRRVSHEGWLEQQRRSTRKEKLEELLKAAYEVHLWLDREKDHVLFDETPNTLPDPTYKVAILEALYFRELGDQIRTFERAALDYKAWILRHKVGLSVARLKKDYVDFGVRLQAATKEFQDVYSPLLAATTLLEQGATATMREALGL